MQTSPKRTQKLCKNINIILLLSCSQKTLHEIAAHLHLVPPLAKCPAPWDRSLLLEVLVTHHERRPSQLQVINDTPLYPTEEVLWDENVVPSDYYNGESEGALYCAVHSCISVQYC